MRKREDNQNVVEKELWLEQIEGEWFVCCVKRHHGKKRVFKRAVREINEKIKEVV